MTSPKARVVRVCESVAGSRKLRLRILGELRRAVGFDSFVFALTDPETCVGSAPVAEVPLLDQLPRLIRLKYATDVNRWTTLGDPPVGLLSAGDPARSLLWREMLAAHGVVDVASMVFRDRFGCWGFLDLWRTGDRPPFGRADFSLLASIAGPVTAALRRSQAETFARPPESTRVGPLVLLLGPDLTLRTQTPETQDYLRILVPPGHDRPPIPAGAYNVAAQLLAVEAGVDAHPPRARVHLSDGLWLTLRAARIGRHDIAVTIEQSTPAERLTVFAPAHGLTARETELLTELASGADTREAAQRLHLSQHTVQDHLKSVFAKTATHSRRELLARALG